jgi:membrane-associated protease RseP (regulator of RpoE activity)
MRTTAMRYVLLLLLLLLGACGEAPRNDASLLTIDSREAGLKLQELPATTLKNLGLPFGLAVVRSGGVAERAGLKIGDVIYGVNQRKAASLEEFNKLLAQQQSGSLGFLVRRGGSDFYVAVELAGAGSRELRPRELPKGPPPRDTLLRT